MRATVLWAEGPMGGNNPKNTCPPYTTRPPILDGVGGLFISLAPSSGGPYHHPDGRKWFEVVLYNTSIIFIYSDGRFSLWTNGWRTAKTKNWINRFSFARVCQDKYEWWVTLPD